jgi:hypothetical protein
MSGPGSSKIRSEYPHPERVAKLKAVKSPRNPAGPFADLTWEQQRAAEARLFRTCAKWEGNLPPWRRAILIGQAKRWAKNPPPPGFGLSLARHQGANATIRKCRAAGVPHPGMAAMRRGLARKRAGNLTLPARQLPI